MKKMVIGLVVILAITSVPLCAMRRLVPAAARIIGARVTAPAALGGLMVAQNHAVFSTRQLDAPQLYRFEKWQAADADELLGLLCNNPMALGVLPLSAAVLRGDVDSVSRQLELKAGEVNNFGMINMTSLDILLLVKQSTLPGFAVTRERFGEMERVLRSHGAETAWKICRERDREREWDKESSWWSGFNWGNLFNCERLTDSDSGGFDD